MIRVAVNTKQFLCDRCNFHTESLHKLEHMPDGWVRVQVKGCNTFGADRWETLGYYCPKCGQECWEKWDSKGSPEPKELEPEQTKRVQ